MKKVSTLATAGLTTLLTIGAMTAPAYAWHPKGTIIKEVQNQTTGTAKSDANTESAAVSATTGDVVLYTVTVSNTGDASSNGYNDMAATKLTDTLPAGVELVSSPSTRTLSENLGTIKPGKSVTKTYAVKVTSSTNGDVITNKACFTGNSTANDNPQSGCDVAVIKVKVDPKPPVTPPTTPTPPATPETPTVLPDTGSTALSASLLVAGAAIIGYAVNSLRLKFQREV
ncbi:MAG TPA: hypothetical protein VLF59_00535 [Candidatus Saccharimonadales bacterium]|nr:hypothetical protein [Candidatus Saccharimonadales bacterium]